MHEAIEIVLQPGDRTWLWVILGISVVGLLYSIGMMALVYLVFEVFVGVQLPGSSLF